MKISFKAPTIIVLSGLVLCAGVGSASAENAAANKQDYSPCIDITLNDDTVFTVPKNQLEKCLRFIDILKNDPDNINIQHVEASPLTYYGLSDGTLLPVLVEYLEECAPYIDELLLIDEENGIENIPDFTTKEAIDRILSMSVEEFRDYVCGSSDDIAVGNDIVDHNGGFWYFSDNAPAEPDSDHKVEGAILDENGEISVIPNGELSPDNKIETHEYGVDETREPHDFTETPDVGNAGVYRGDGWVYPCDYADDMASDISEIVIDYVPNADDMTYVREVQRNYDEQKTKYGQMLPTDYTDIPQEVTYGIMTDIDGLMVSHMKYVSNGKTEIYTDREGEKVATLNYIDTQNAEIVFENGSIASEEDLTPGSAVFVEYDVVYETYPGNMRCTRIVILQ